MKRFSLISTGLVSVALLAACGGGGGGGSGSSPPEGQAQALKTAPAQNPAAKVTGAIFTNEYAVDTASCTGVNRNLYESKATVGLDGGPERATAAGLLPNTRYYVQVTDPSGSQVLGTSVKPGVTDQAQRAPVLTDVNGKFVSCLQLGAIVWEVVGGTVQETRGFIDTPNNGGEYKVWVSTSPTFDNAYTKTDNFKVKSVVVVASSDPRTVEVWKFYDANANGVRDSGEPLLPWKVDIAGLPVLDTTASGPASFTPLPLGAFTARELTPDQTNWVSTNAYLGGYTAPLPPFTLSSPTALALNQIGVDITESSPTTQSVHFGNVCLGKGGGRTLGFWSNKNGQALLTPQVLAELRALNLKNASGGDFDPTTNAELRKWLLDGNATNMAYMLSVQMAAMHLNLRVGFATADPMLYAPGLATVNTAGFISASGLVAEANASLGTDGYTRAGTPVRVYQERLKNVLDAGNNDRDIFVQPTPCAGVTFNGALALIQPVVPTVAP